MDNLAQVWGVVLICSLVQSVFGVGLLLIGTPLLLLLDVPFGTALWLLLPASLTISLLQLVLSPRIDRDSVRKVSAYALPSLIVGVLVSLNGIRAPQLDVLVALVLLGSALMRIVGRFASNLRIFSTRHDSAMLALIGFVHGFSNLGGGLLAAYATARHVDKHAARETIAVAYALFATTQLVVLTLMGNMQIGSVTIVMVCTAAMTFLTLGRIAFRRLSIALFNSIFTVLMLIMAALLIMKSARIFA